MSKDKDKHTDDTGGSDEGFGLIPPTGQLARRPTGDRPPLEHSETLPARPRPDSKEQYKPMGWKGLEDHDDGNGEDDTDVSFLEKGHIGDDELDMTPMVDVTFLLLIFFMVTASFTLQKSIQQPPPKIDDPSPNAVEIEDEEDYVEVIIDQTNTYLITTRDSEEIEAPSDREMRARLRDAKNSTDTNRLIIRAHVDSMHGKVVTVWDAGISAGMERIEVRTTDEDF